MRLLLFTQALDMSDPVLSVYHRWVEEFARRFEKVLVVCLKKGDFNLPQNVEVLSLGKESSPKFSIFNFQFSIPSRFRYLWRFYRFIFSKKNGYDAVFIHMNQEYILLGGIFWRLWKKPIYMWRNHHAGTVLTDLAASFCKKVFCTSKFSYTAKYKKTVLMPVGIDTEKFVKLEGQKVHKVRDSILFLARIAPVKKPHVLVEALKVLKSRGVSFTADMYGDPLPKDKEYFEKLKQSAREIPQLSFRDGVPNAETVDVYNNHEIFVNLSSSGMYDKTIFEAMACETLTLASNENLRGLVRDEFIFKEGDVNDLASKLQALLSQSQEDKERKGKELRKIVIEHHSLSGLGEKLAKELS